MAARFGRAGVATHALMRARARARPRFADRFTFAITAAMQGLGALAMLPLLAVVPRREAPVPDKRDNAVAAVNGQPEQHESTLSEPLLP